MWYKYYVKYIVKIIKKLYNIGEQISTCTLVLKVGILIGNDQSDKFYLSFVLVII